MKLFLDDIRTAPSGYQCVRSYKDCIFMLGTQEIELASLDFSLGERFTGLDVLKWMADNSRYPAAINIHSSHSYGRMQMKAYILNHFPKGYPFTVNSMLY